MDYVRVSKIRSIHRSYGYPDFYASILVIIMIYVFYIQECLVDSDCTPTMPLCDVRTGSCMEGKHHWYNICPVKQRQNCLLQFILVNNVLYQPILDVGYVFLSSTTCDGYGLSYSDLNSAEEECSHNSGCGGIWDHYCDNAGFFLCYSGTIIDNTNEYCVYEKTGNSYL